MRIVHLDTGRSWRGGQAQVLLLMRGLAARGHDGLLLAPEAPLLARGRAAGLETGAWSPRGDLDLGAVARAHQLVAPRGADLVHCHSAHAQLPGAIVGRLLRVPVVVSRRVVVGVAGHPLSRLKYRFGVDRYLCVSRAVIETMRRAGVAPERLAWVPSGIDLEASGADAAGPAFDLRSAIGAPADAPIVGTVASLTAEKNHIALLEAAPEVLARAPEVRFVWIGDGPCRARLAARVAGAGLEPRVHLLGARDDARALIRQFTVFALPSLHEGIGTSVLDAQAASVPVVAACVGGIPEAIEDGVNGRLVDPRDSSGLARALLEALAETGPREAWIARARESVGRFGAEAMVERTVAEYRRVMDERGRRARVV